MINLGFDPVIHNLPKTLEMRKMVITQLTTGAQVYLMPIQPHYWTICMQGFYITLWAETLNQKYNI